MMIPPAGASDPYAAAAALDRQLRASSSDLGDASSADATPDSGPDVVVTLSKDTTPSSPSTYDASGRMSGAPTLADMGANAPDSMAKATESDGNDDDASSTSNAASPTADASADEDAAVAA